MSSSENSMEANLGRIVRENRQHHVLDLLKSADAALEIIHLDPARVQPLTLRDIAAVRELLNRIASRTGDIQTSLFGPQ